MLIAKVVPYWSAKSGITSEEDASGVVVVVVEAVVVLAATTSTVTVEGFNANCDAECTFENTSFYGIK